MTQQRRPKVPPSVRMVAVGGCDRELIEAGVDRGEVFATRVIADQDGSRTGTRELPSS